MNKKKITALISGVLMLTVLTSCGGNTQSSSGGNVQPPSGGNVQSSSGGNAQPSSGEHTHSASVWHTDLENHWYVCDICDETFAMAAHTLESTACSACGSEVTRFEDGGAQLMDFNAYGDCTRAVYYAADGSVRSEDRSEYTYDDAGNIRAEKVYLDGKPFLERTQNLSADGELYLASETVYMDDGAEDYYVYDEKSNYIHTCSYDADGNVTYANDYEYSDDGSRTYVKTYYGDMLAEEQEYLVTEDGEQINLKYVLYNEDGSYSVSEYDEHGYETLEGSYDASGKAESELRYENEYDAQGNRILRRTYQGDRLTEEMEFVIFEDGWQSGKTTTYHEDGTKTVNDGDVEATWSSETTYDAAGNVIEEIRYEYEENESGDFTGSKGYKNGKLFKEVQGIVGDDGQTIGTRWIDYNEDGTKTVAEYDEFFDLVKKTVYDADGNVISES